MVGVEKLVYTLQHPIKVEIMMNVTLANASQASVSRKEMEIRMDYEEMGQKEEE